LYYYSCFKKKAETNNGFSAVGHKALLKKNSAEGLGDTSEVNVAHRLQSWKILIQSLSTVLRSIIA